MVYVVECGGCGPYAGAESYDAYLAVIFYHFQETGFEGGVVVEDNYIIVIPLEMSERLMVHPPVCEKQDHFFTPVVDSLYLHYIIFAAD